MRLDAVSQTAAQRARVLYAPTTPLQTLLLEEMGNLYFQKH